jgi:hypothetical protein
MKTPIKLYLSIAVLAGLGAAVYVQKQGKQKVVDAHSYAAKQAQLPNVALSETDAAALTKLVLKQAAKPAEEGKAATPAVEVVLEKQGETWAMTAPVAYAANQPNIENLLKNFEKLVVKEQIADSTATYADYGLGDDSGLQVTAFAGEDEKLALQVGQSGSRGQMVRVGETDGVFTLDGYSSYLYERPAKDWRDKSILELNPDEVQSLKLENSSGIYQFVKEGEAWKSNFKPAKPGLSLKNFDSAKVDDLVRAYKELKAFEFEDKKAAAELGLEEPVATLSFSLTSGVQQVLRFGDAAESKARYALLGANPQVFQIGSWSSDWAVAEPEKFEAAVEEN